jgi:peptide-methionine (S)-S-oxide reductase
MIGQPSTGCRRGDGTVRLSLPQPRSKVAEQVIHEMEMNKVWGKPIVTQLVPFNVFYQAEAYHQEYFKRNPYQGYCMAVIAPKVSKFRHKYLEKLKA